LSLVNDEAEDTVEYNCPTLHYSSDKLKLAFVSLEFNLGDQVKAKVCYFG
jgi:hypothetical protein